MKLDKFTIFVLASLGLFLLWLYGIFSYGFAIVKLWTWFVVPVFHPDVKLGIMQAAGLFMFVRFFTSDHKLPKFNEKDSDESKVAAVFLPLVIPWMAVIFGWVLKSIMS